MSTTALGMETVGEASSHTVTPMAPNMCITPAAPSPLPMPYPLMGTSSQLAEGTSNTQVENKKALTSDGKIKQVNGNEPGTQKDIITFTTSGKAFSLPVPAMQIHLEGAPTAVTGNMGFANTQ